MAIVNTPHAYLTPSYGSTSFHVEILQYKTNKIMSKIVLVVITLKYKIALNFAPSRFLFNVVCKNLLIITK